MEKLLEPEKNLLENVHATMVDTLEKSREAMQNYVDLLGQTTRSIPTASEMQLDAFKAYIGRQVAANHAFVDKLLRSRDFLEALRIQAEYSQSQLKAGADDAAQLGTKLSDPPKRSVG